MIESSRCREGSGSGWRCFFRIAWLAFVLAYKVAAVSLHSVRGSSTSIYGTWRSSYRANLVA